MREKLIAKIKSMCFEEYYKWSKNKELTGYEGFDDNWEIFTILQSESISLIENYSDDTVLEVYEDIVNGTQELDFDDAYDRYKEDFDVYTKTQEFVMKIRYYRYGEEEKYLSNLAPEKLYSKLHACVSELRSNFTNDTEFSLRKKYPEVYHFLYSEC